MRKPRTGEVWIARGRRNHKNYGIFKVIRYEDIPIHGLVLWGFYIDDNAHRGHPNNREIEEEGWIAVDYVEFVRRIPEDINDEG